MISQADGRTVHLGWASPARRFQETQRHHLTWFVDPSIPTLEVTLISLSLGDVQWMRKFLVSTYLTS